MIWTVVGLALITVGANWSYPRLPLWFLALAIAAGSLKSIFILDRTARKNLGRITKFADGTCIGAVYSIRMWLVVAFMVVMGRLLRSSSFPMEYVGLLYCTIGWALLLSSRLMWRKWAEHSAHSGVER